MRDSANLRPIDTARKAAIGGVPQMKERDIVGAEESFDGRIEIVCPDQCRIDDFFGFRVGADDELLPEIVVRRASDRSPVAIDLFAALLGQDEHWAILVIRARLRERCEARQDQLLSGLGPAKDVAAGLAALGFDAPYGLAEVVNTFAADAIQEGGGDWGDDDRRRWSRNGECV